MNFRLATILKFVGLLILVIVVSIVPELIGGDIEEMLRQRLGENYFWIILSIGLAGLIAYTF